MTLKRIISKIFSYFIRGLLLSAPVFLTGYVILGVFNWLDSKFYFFFPGAGLLTVAIVITFVGALGSTFFSVPVFNIFESAFKKIPFVGFIYTSVKDLIDAFVGDKRKFNKPVLLILNKESGIRKIGFLTQEYLSYMDLEEMVTVYCPHSYAFSG